MKDKQMTDVKARLNESLRYALMSHITHNGGCAVECEGICDCSAGDEIVQDINTLILDSIIDRLPIVKYQYSEFVRHNAVLVKDIKKLLG